jgi:DNA (cytosine-5)-methyltransferase 1
MDKPPYVIPSMTDVAATRGSNGYKVVSTFSGCGGSCLGFEMAGFEVVWASEFVPEARDTYALNHPDVPINPSDIRSVRAADILAEAGLDVGEVDVMEGSPPCSSFSMAGKREKHWGQATSYSETEQRTDDLFFEFARLVEGVQPKVFVAENVAGLVQGTAKGYFKDILRRLKACGYQVEAKVLDAKWLGVPQSRRRLIFVGVRDDLGARPAFPKPFPYQYSIRDACPWITNGGYRKARFGAVETAGVSVDWDSDEASQVVTATGIGGGARHQSVVAPPMLAEWSSDEVAPTVTASGMYAMNAMENLINPPDSDGPGEDNAWYEYLIANGHPEVTDPAEMDLVDIRRYAIGREWLRLQPGSYSPKFYNLFRADADAAMATITQTAGVSAGTAGVTHPSEPRKFTIPELRQLHSFPADFQLTGRFSQRWERIGRSVPPLMMKRIAEVVRDDILG